MNNSEAGSTVQRLQVEEVAAQPKKVTNLREVPIQAQPQTAPTPPPTSPGPQIIVQRAGIPEAIVAAFAALGYALSARLILLLSLVGAFVIGIIAIRAQTIMALAILVAYAALTVIPATYLEVFGPRPEG